MSTIIVVRILPKTPTTGVLFTQYLQGLELSAFDRTVSNTSPDLETGALDDPLGTASGLPVLPPTVASLQALPGLTVAAGSNPPAYETSIIQHYAEDHPPPPTGLPTFSSVAVATALIVVNVDPNTYSDYPTPTSFDVRMAVTRNSNAVPVPVEIEYNIIPTSLGAGNTINNATNTYSWATGLAASLYVWVPAPLPSNSIGFVPPGNSFTPPNFYTLAAAVDKVLAKDSPLTATSLETLTVPLTIAQCGEIASELMYERVSDPPPDVPVVTEPFTSPTVLEQFYTSTLNQAQIPSGSSNSLTWVGIRFSISTLCSPLDQADFKTGRASTVMGDIVFGLL
jgi:hypothetical protein